MKITPIRFVASEMVASPILRFLTTTFVGLVGFCIGLVLYWQSPVVLVIMIAPLSMGVSAVIAVLPAIILACIPFRRFSSRNTRIILPAALVSASMLSGVAGFYFGEALTGI